jgi:hypothetical protein
MPGSATTRKRKNFSQAKIASCNPVENYEELPQGLKPTSSTLTAGLKGLLHPEIGQRDRVD